MLLERRSIGVLENATAFFATMIQGAELMGIKALISWKPKLQVLQLVINMYIASKNVTIMMGDRAGGGNR